MSVLIVFVVVLLPHDCDILQVEQHNKELTVDQIVHTERIASLQAQQQTMQTTIASLQQKRAQTQSDNRKAQQHLSMLQKTSRETLQNVQVIAVLRMELCTEWCCSCWVCWSAGSECCNHLAALLNKHLLRAASFLGVCLSAYVVSQPLEYTRSHCHKFPAPGIPQPKCLADY